jgi:hypothetical protein
MASERTIREIEYLVQVEGAAALDQLTERMDRANTELDKAAEAYHDGTINAEQYHAAVRRLTGIQADAAAKIVLANGAIANNGKVLQDTSQQAAAAGRAFLEFGRAAEDFSTAGFLGVINNIPTMLGNIGTAAGLTAKSISVLTGGIAVAGAAAYTLYNNWDWVLKQLGFAAENLGTDLERLKGRAKELEKVEIKTTVDRTELEETLRTIEEADRAFKAFRESVSRLSEVERKSGAAVGRILGEAPGSRKMQEQLAVDLGRQLLAESGLMEDLEEQERQVRGMAGPEHVRRGMLDAITTERERLEHEFVYSAQSKGRQLLGERIGAAQRGDAAAIEELARLMGGRAGAAPEAVLGRFGGPGDIAGQLRAVTPERIREDAAEEEAAGRLREEAQRKEAERRARGQRFREEQRRLEERTADDIRNQEEAERIAKAQDAARLRDDLRNMAEAERVADQRRREVERVAKANALAVQGAGGDLTRGVVGAFGGGLDPDAIVRRFQGEAGRRLGRVPGMDPGMIGEVARQVIQDEIAKQAPRFAALGGNRFAALGMLGEMAENRFDAAQQEAAGDQRRGAGLAQQQLASQLNRQGMNQQAAMAVSGRVLNLVQQGINEQFALAQAIAEMGGRLGRMEQQQQRASQQRARGQRHGNMQRGTAQAVR